MSPGRNGGRREEGGGRREGRRRWKGGGREDGMEDEERWSSTVRHKRRPSHPSLSSPLTSRKKLHDEVQIDDILKGVVHFHNPRIVCLHQNVPFSSCMCNLGNVKVGKTFSVPSPLFSFSPSPSSLPFSFLPSSISPSFLLLLHSFLSLHCLSLLPPFPLFPPAPSPTCLTCVVSSWHTHAQCPTSAPELPPQKHLCQ